ESAASILNVTLPSVLSSISVYHQSAITSLKLSGVAHDATLSSTVSLLLEVLASDEHPLSTKARPPNTAILLKVFFTCLECLDISFLRNSVEIVHEKGVGT